MIIAGSYSFNNGERYINQKFPDLLKEVENIIESIDANIHKTKKKQCQGNFYLTLLH